MKRIMLCVALVFLAGCWRFSTDVSFTTDSRVLRGTWTGTLEKQCENVTSFATFSPDGTRFFTTNAKDLEIFATADGTKQGSFTVQNRTSPIIWSADNSGLVYIRTSTNLGLERVTVNPITGADVTVSPLTGEFSGSLYAYSQDLTRVALVNSSSINGVTRINQYDLLTGNLLKSVALPNITPTYLTLSQDGTKVAYGASLASKTQVFVLDFATEIIIKVFEESVSSLTLRFFGTNQLRLTYTQYGNAVTPTIIKRINLTTLATQDTSIPLYGGYQIRESSDGTRIGYFIGKTLIVKNLETGAIVSQIELETTSNYSPIVLSSNDSGTIWLVSGTRVGCTLRIFDATQQVFTTNDISLTDDDFQTAVFTFVPTFQSSKRYTLTGTVKMGSGPERKIVGAVTVPEYCSLFAGDCEQLVKTAPPPYYTSIYDGVHNVQFEYENGVTFGFYDLLVGKRKDTKKVQLFGERRNNTDGKRYSLQINPVVAP